MEPVTPRTTLRRLAAALLLALACSVALGGCGEEDGGQDDVEGLLDRAFRNSIARADLRIDAHLTLDGLRGFDRPVRLQASGPYIAGGRGLPLLDIDLNLGAQGAGQTVQFGLLRTPDRAFVKFGGEFYEQPRSEVRRANRDVGAARGRRRLSLRDLGLAPRTWVVGARDEGDEKVAGVETHHVSGRLDIRSVLRDLNELVERSASAVGSGSSDIPDPLSARQLDDLAEMVRNAGFDVYVGKEDEVIRRLSAQLEVRVPEGDRSRVGGIEAGAVRFSIEFRNVDGEQVVKAPAKARPVADLTEQLGGLSALGGFAGDAGGSGDGSGRRPPAGGSDQAPRRGGPRPDRTQEGDGVEAFRRYSECLDRADPDNTRALARCAELLR